MSHRLNYSLIAAQGRVLLQWSEPIRAVKLPWDVAYPLVNQMNRVGKRAEAQAGLTVDRGGSPPDPVDAQIRPEGGAVWINFGVLREVFDWSPVEAFAIANAILISAQTAQRWGTKGPGMTSKEVDKLEEAILGEPKVVIGGAGTLVTKTLPPLVGESYHYRPEGCRGRVVSLDAKGQRADFLLGTGQILEGVAWADLFEQKPVPSVAGLGNIPSVEAVNGPSLS